jgi:hypothetical protein
MQVADLAWTEARQPLSKGLNCGRFLWFLLKPMDGDGSFRRERGRPLDGLAAGICRRLWRRTALMANRLLLGLDDVAPYNLGCLVTLGCKVCPGFRLIECHRIIQAVPFDHGHVLGSRPAVYLNDPSGRGA